MKDNFLYLVFNLGFHSIRGVIFSSDGTILKKYSRPVVTYMHGQGVEQNPSEWLEQIKSILKEAVSDISIRNRLHYISVTASASCLIVSNAQNQLFSNALMVADKRAFEEANYLRQIPAALEVAGGQLSKLDLTQMLPKILWWRKNNAHLSSGEKHQFMSPNDFIARHFTGQFVTDTYNAEKFLYDTKKNKYSEELLSILEIEENQLPKVVDAGTNIGNIRLEICQEFGLNKDTQFIISTYDAICGFWGAGPSKLGDACDISGTVTSLRVLTQSHQLDATKANGLFCLKTEEPELSILGGSNNLGGGLVEWLKNTFYHEEKEHIYLKMEEEAHSSLVGAKGLIFLPYLLGERAPLWNSKARGVFFGLEHYHRRPDFSRSVFESVGFSLLSLSQSVEEAGAKINRIKVSGGLSRIRLINQMKADITQKEIHVSDEIETSSLGAFLYMGKAVGLFSNLRSAADHFSQTREIIFPNQKLSNHYGKIYELYKEIYTSLRWSFEKRAELFAEFYDGKISESGEF